MRRKRQAREGAREKENSSARALRRSCGEFIRRIFTAGVWKIARRSEIAYLSGANRDQLLLIERCYLMHVGAECRYRSSRFNFGAPSARTEEKKNASTDRRLRGEATERIERPRES